jgi:hypothetical protein
VIRTAGSVKDRPERSKFIVHRSSFIIHRSAFTVRLNPAGRLADRSAVASAGDQDGGLGQRPARAVEVHRSSFIIHHSSFSVHRSAQPGGTPGRSFSVQRSAFSVRLNPAGRLADRSAVASAGDQDGGLGQRPARAVEVHRSSFIIHHSSFSVHRSAQPGGTPGRSFSVPISYFLYPIS